MEGGFAPPCNAGLQLQDSILISDYLPRENEESGILYLTARCFPYLAPKTSIMGNRIKTIAVLGAAAVAAISCEGLFEDGRKASLSVCFDRSQFATKAGREIPDTNGFLLWIRDSKGKEVYGGRFGDMPEHLEVKAGTYDISVRSSEMSGPSFSAPVFGDDQCVTVPKGGVERVRLVCVQVNSGIRLRVAPDFLTSYPRGVLFVRSEDGRLMYSYSEKRIAYFRPGPVNLMMDEDGRQTDLMTRTLEAREILTVGVSAPPPGNGQDGIGGIVVTVDTTRIWTGTDIVIGGETGGSAEDNAIDVPVARSLSGRKGVWVQGYLCGAFKSTSKICVEAPFPSATNCAISGRPRPSGLDSMLSVELKKGRLRDELNLADNPGNLGRKVYLRGDLVEAYYGIPGIRNVTEYRIK